MRGLGFNTLGPRLRTDPEALWHILLSIFADPLSRPITLLVDALDECDSSTQKNMSSKLRRLFAGSSSIRLKAILLIRPEEIVLNILKTTGLSVSIDTRTISDDLEEYISQEVATLQETNSLADQSCETIRRQLHAKNGGTFHWVSFAIQAMSSETTAKEMITVLSKFPCQIYDVYDRTLSEIEPKHCRAAITMLRTILVAGDSLTVRDLAMLICVKDPENTELPTPLQVRESRGSYRHCRPLIDFTSIQFGTNPHLVFVRFVHASVRDYLTSGYLRNHVLLSQFYCEIASCHLDMFEHCSRYRSYARGYVSKQRMPRFSTATTTSPFASEHRDLPLLLYPAETSWLSREDVSYVHGDRFREFEKYYLSDRQNTISCFISGSFGYRWPRRSGFSTEAASTEALSICLLLDIPLIRHCTLAQRGKRYFFQNFIYLSTEPINPKITHEALRITESFGDPDLLCLSFLHESTYWMETFCKLNYIGINHVVQDTTALVTAIGYNDVESVRIALSHRDIDVNLCLAQPNTGGSITPLICACRVGCEQIAELLLNCPEIKIDLYVPSDISDLGWHWPLQQACLWIHDYNPGIISMLLDRGAQRYTNILNDILLSGLSRLFNGSRSTWGYLQPSHGIGEPARRRIFPGRIVGKTMQDSTHALKPLIERLIRSGHKMDTPSYGITPLTATILGDTTGKQPHLLLSLGADSEVSNSRGQPPASVAAGLMNEEGLAVILSHGTDVQATDRKGLTVLAYAVRTKIPTSVEFPKWVRDTLSIKHDGQEVSTIISIIARNARALLNSGADPFAVDYRGYTALSKLCTYFYQNVLFPFSDAEYYEDPIKALGDVLDIFEFIVHMLPPDRDVDSIAEMVQRLRMSDQWHWEDHHTALLAKELLELIIDSRSWDKRFRAWQVMARNNGWKAEPDIVYQLGSVWLMAWVGAGVYRLSKFCISRYLKRVLGGMEDSKSEWGDATKYHRIKRYRRGSHHTEVAV